MGQPPQGALTTTPNLRDPDTGNWSHQMIVRYFRKKKKVAFATRLEKVKSETFFNNLNV